MAIDLEAIRRRVKELSGNRKNSSIQLWKPELGEYKVRGIPWKPEQTSDGMPLIERWFYYIGEAQSMLSPSQFGKPDPVNDLIRKLYNSGKPDDRVIAKSLQPRMRAYMALIVRGQEDKGVFVWAFGKPVYQRLLSFYADEEVGDILDPETGFDLKVSLTHQQGKMFKGRPSIDTSIDPARRQSKLSEDPAQAKAWLESVPDLDDMYKLKTFAEMEGVLNNWLSGGDQTSSDSGSDGTQRGVSAGDDALTKLANEIKSESPPKAAKAPKKEDKKKAAPDVEVAEESVKKQSLDDAFKELMTDEDDSSDE